MFNCVCFGNMTSSNPPSFFDDLSKSQEDPSTPGHLEHRQAWGAIQPARLTEVSEHDLALL